MSGFGGAGAFSDGKYNITNAFGGTLYEYIGKNQAIDLMKYVDGINMKFGGEGTKLYSTAGTSFKKLCMQNKLTLLDASVRHLGTDINFIVLENLYAELKDKVTFYFDTPVKTVEALDPGYRISCEDAPTSVTNASSPWGAAAANGWNRSVRIWISTPSPTVWISVSAWSFPLSSSLI